MNRHPALSAWRRQSPLAAALRELAATMANAPVLAVRNFPAGLSAVP